MTDILKLNARLGRGVNLGDALEVSPQSKFWLELKPEFFLLIKEAGFDSIRLPARFSAYAQPEPPYIVSEAFLDRVDWAVEQALAAGLPIIIDLHHYQEYMVDPAGHLPRLVGIWEQLAARYQAAPESVYFELCNEPTHQVPAAVWNQAASELVKTVRKTNPTRAIIIGTVNWNSVLPINTLVLPEDRNLIATVHYYHPMEFTHQGARWVEGSDAWLGTRWHGTPEELATIEAEFEPVTAWAKKHNRPIYLGEFGAYSKADMPSRARYTAAVARAAERRGWSWGYWEFGWGFGVYDPQAKMWRKELLKALIPEA
jgi:endoglucanase